MNESEPKIRTIAGPTEMLKNMLSIWSKEVNSKIKNKYGLQNLLLTDGSLNPDGYKEVYNEEEIREHTKTIRDCEIKFSSATNEGVQKHYLEQFGAKNEDEIVAKWREDRPNQKSGQMEMATTMLLAKKLGKDFLVVRTERFDDYENGVDNLIIDLRTGEVIGAFDELHKVGKDDREKNKKEKIIDVAERGGAEVAYGLKFVDGKLVRGPLKGVPVFYLSLKTEELLDLEEGLAKNDREKTDKIFQLLLNSLSSQCEELKGYTRIPEFKAKLSAFQQTISTFTNNQIQKAA